MAKISYEPIGVIHSPFKEQASTPIHGVYAPESRGEVDVVDGTPLLDIKPYVPDFDSRLSVKTGWYEHGSNRSEYERKGGIAQRLEDFE